MNAPTIRTQTNTPRTAFPPRSFLLYGDPKVGKTTCGSQFPAPIMLNCAVENGTSEIAGDVVDYRTPADLTGIIRWLRDSKHAYQSILWDGLSRFVIDVVAKQDGRHTKLKVKQATEILQPIINEYLALPYIRVITGHARRDIEELDGGKKKISIFPDLPPSLRQFVEGGVDAIAYCYAKDGKSFAWWLPCETDLKSIAAGNRLGLPQTTALNYKAIHDVLVKPAPTQPQRPPAPVTADPNIKNGSAQKWADFRRNISDATITAAIGTVRPSEWMAGTGKTIDDCIAAVKEFIALVDTVQQKGARS